MRLANRCREIVLSQRRLDPRHEIAAIHLVVGMLELAPTALGEMAARRFLVVPARSKRAIVEQCVARNSESDVTPT
jgi:hypothetical protein